MRDVDAGFVAERPGRVSARAALASPHALVWRLTSGSIVGWAIGGAITGILATTLSGVVDRISGENPAVADILKKIGGAAGGLDEVVVTVFFTLLGILAACAAVQTVARARQEEARGTAEAVLATPVGRVRWLADYMMVGVAAVLIVVAAAVLAGWVGAWSNGGRRVALSHRGGGRIRAGGRGLDLRGADRPGVRAAPAGDDRRGVEPRLLAALLGMFGPLFDCPSGARTSRRSR